ncbi:AraC family transcriptional regulator [Vitiosangium sp. GDMCC 1.1324]|uniref:AraC family transcriptional regulator n=1 Tax=Vitiosangium sp. (strain GDMCC 1.1324) TaxID=2138576 RepID=UPI000D35279E|nr:AraC family transcriptional regulator [Vitiosangium sp. GDMCC 1.1324]PTL81253.1 AraC family transcriptional regulator [Vitiosangium sp. GDMCC 1.1324]
MPAALVTLSSVLLDRLAALGVDVPRLLRHAGVLPSRFQPSKARLTIPEFFAFWRALEEVGGSRDLGLRVGAEALPHQLDVASLAALHSPSLGEALKKFARYKRLCTEKTVRVETTGGEARISFHWENVEEALPLMLVDASFASLLALARRGTGSSLVPRRVELVRRRSDEAMLRRHFGCEVRFDAPLDLLVFEETALARPFVTHNADLLAVMLPGLEAALSQSMTPRSLADDVREVLGRSMRGESLGLERIAREVHMSSRTLQRRLKELGTSYQSLLDDVRRDTSRRLLASTDLDTGEIAFLLGFEELNSFTRAFHVWEGMPPTRWRESQRGHS